MGAPGRAKRCVCSLTPFYTGSTIFSLFYALQQLLWLSPSNNGCGQQAFFPYHCTVLGGYEGLGPYRIMRGETHGVGDPPGM